MLGFKYRRSTLFILLAICLTIFWARIFLIDGAFSRMSHRQINSWSWSGLLKNDITKNKSTQVSSSPHNRSLHTASKSSQSHQYLHKEPVVAKHLITNLSSVPVSVSLKPPEYVERIDLVIRSAFVDSRARDHHINSTVIFVEASKEFRRHELMVGCGVDGQEAEEYRVHTLYWDWIDYRYPKLTHEEVMVVCYDIQAHNGSAAFIRYRVGPNSTIVNRKDVTIVSTSNRSDKKGTVVICTTCYGKPPWLSEWLRYQKTLGVDLVQMYVEDKFIEDSQNKEITQPYVEEEFLKIEFRKTYFNSTQIYYHSQTLNYNDCLYRHQNTHQYAMFVDTDDFFVPRLYDKTSLAYYLRKFMLDQKAAVRFHWHRFFPDCGLLQAPDSVKDGNITSKLKVKESIATVNTKFACRSSVTTQVTVHKPLHLLDGYHEAYTVDSNEAYVAHVRLHQHQGLPENITCNR